MSRDGVKGTDGFYLRQKEQNLRGGGLGNYGGSRNMKENDKVTNTAHGVSGQAYDLSERASVLAKGFINPGSP